MTDWTLPPLPPIQRTEIDGIPTLWMDEPGPMVAMLLFRVGRCDEPTPLGGVSHIVEHLALAGLGVQDYDHNGFVDGDSTVFTSIGRPDEVVAFLNTVVAELADLPLDRLLLERRILREEREQRGPSIDGALRWYRFGHAGHGRGLGPSDDELGLDWIGPDRVAEWARTRFTRQNAVLWMTGAPPSGLRLAGLPDGSPAPRPGIEAIPGIRFPTHVAWEGPGANLSLVAARSAAINLSVNIAHRRARQQLRFDQGLVYDVAMDYEPLTPDQTHVMLSADCQEDRIAPVLDGLLGILRDLEATGPTDAELEAEMRSYVRQYDDRDGRIGLLAATAFDTLWGGETFTAEQFLDMRRAVGPAEAQAAMAAAMPSLLVLGNRPPIDGVPPYPMWSDMPIGGREHGPAGFFLPGRKPPERLWVASEGLTLAWDASSYMTVRYADVVACVHHEPEVRTLLGRDGIRVTVDAKAWKGGAGIITEIDAAVPFELVACAEHGIGGLEDPVTEPRSPAAAGSSG